MTLALPELIRESIRLINQTADPDVRRVEMRNALAAGISAQKLLAYLPVLRRVEQWRASLAQQITHQLAAYDRLLAAKNVEAASHYVMATQLAGEQEVIVHFFVIAVGRIDRALRNIAAVTGYEIENTDSSTLVGYRDLRNYFEHMENELPGGKKERDKAKIDPSILTNDVMFGLRNDDTGRTKVGNKTVDVTGRGLDALESIIQKVCEGCESECLKKVEAFFETNSENIPDIDDIDISSLVSIGRF